MWKGSPRVLDAVSDTRSNGRLRYSLLKRRFAKLAWQDDFFSTDLKVEGFAAPLNVGEGQGKGDPHMLVLARRATDKVCFPNLGISIEVLRINGNTVRLGIDAPADVKVLRHELVERYELETCSAQLESDPGKFSHDLRNRINTATLALHLMQRQIDADQVTEAEKTLQKALRVFQDLDQNLGAANTQTRADSDARRRVLLVEDDANERELLSGILQMNGFTVDTADDGLAAMGYLSQHHLPDVVLMDMRMPRLDGPKTVSAIRRAPNYSGVKLFAVSATDPRELGVRTGPQGIDRWFSKPIDPSSLVVELNRVAPVELN